MKTNEIIEDKDSKQEENIAQQLNETEDLPLASSQIHRVIKKESDYPYSNYS